MELALILLFGLGVGTLSGVTGFGSSIMLMPVLVWHYGPRQAVPIMAVAALLANLSRIAVWWREVDWRACAAYAVTGAPAAALGALTMLSLPPALVDGALGVFFIAMIWIRRHLAASDWKATLWHLALAGAIVGYVTGVVVSTGPITVPIFLAYGLVKGAFIATEAAASLAVYASKAIVFREFGALPMDIFVKGLTIGASLMVGSLLAKRFVRKLDADDFRLLMDGLMLVSGLMLLWAAVRA